jgi:hypothetical protein
MHDPQMTEAGWAERVEAELKEQGLDRPPAEWAREPPELTAAVNRARTEAAMAVLATPHGTSDQAAEASEVAERRVRERWAERGGSAARAEEAFRKAEDGLAEQAERTASPLDTALRAQQDALTALERSLTVLEDRLAPVMRQPTDVSVDEPSDESDCELLRRLDLRTHEATVLRDRLESIARRLVL